LELDDGGASFPGKIFKDDPELDRPQARSEGPDEIKEKKKNSDNTNHGQSESIFGLIGQTNLPNQEPDFPVAVMVVITLILATSFGESLSGGAG
jgi:hypothetical protein